jgi:hypothetical protein
MRLLKSSENQATANADSLMEINTTVRVNLSAGAAALRKIGTQEGSLC